MFKQKIESVEELRKILQGGIVIENAACVLYLTFLFSIIPGKNKEVKRIIKRIAIEEMAHMIVFSNLLCSVGGKPKFVEHSPVFPTKLPYDILPGITFDLGGLTIEALKEAGMQIERAAFIQKHQVCFEHELPEFSISSLREHLKKTNVKIERRGQTMCEFIENLRDNLIEMDKKFGSELWCGDKEKQFSMELPKFKKVEAVEDLPSALRVLDRLIEESEGSENYIQNSHYFTFSQIVKGERLVRDENDPKKVVWKNVEKVDFDETQLIKLRKISDPSKELNEEEKETWDKFHESYLHMMKFFDGIYDLSVKRDAREIGRIMKELDELGKLLGKFGICPDYKIGHLV